MTANIWRGIVIDKGVDLSYDNGCLKVTDKEGEARTVPLYNVRTVMISSTQARLTAYLVNELNRRGISLVFCDERRRPTGEIVGYAVHHASPGRLRDQLRWKKAVRLDVWGEILRQKLTMQKRLLELLGYPVDEQKWASFLADPRPSDPSNREGQAARIYFNLLFGPVERSKRRQSGGETSESAKRFRFLRRVPSPINALLDYGYAIIASAISRSIVLHGFHPALGVAHRGATNPFNLTYDIIEPFRPFVDRLVYLNRDRELDRAMRHELIELPNSVVRYNNHRTELVTAIDLFVVDVTRSLTEGEVKIGKLGFPPKKS